MKSQNEVIKILESSQLARDDDTNLLWFYAVNKWYSQEVIEFIMKEQDFIKNHIRIRAKLQREGKYLASPEVRKKRERHRKIKANEMRTPLVVTEVTGSKVEEKEMKTWFFNWLQRLWK